MGDRSRRVHFTVPEWVVVAQCRTLDRENPRPRAAAHHRGLDMWLKDIVNGCFGALHEPAGGDLISGYGKDLLYRSAGNTFPCINDAPQSVSYPAIRMCREAVFTAAVKRSARKHRGPISDRPTRLRGKALPPASRERYRPHHANRLRHTLACSFRRFSGALPIGGFVGSGRQAVLHIGIGHLRANAVALLPVIGQAPHRLCQRV